MIFTIQIKSVSVPNNNPSNESTELITTKKGKIDFAKNNQVKASVNLENLDIILTDKNNNELHTIPESILNNKNTNGIIAMNMLSQLIVQYVDSVNQQYTANSKVGSVNQNTYTVEKGESYIIIIYDFSRKEQQFSIPVMIKLVENYVDVQILFDKIIEYGDTRSISVDLMPYFCAGTKQDNGFMLMPDGSGSIVDFKLAPDTDAVKMR